MEDFYTIYIVNGQKDFDIEDIDYTKFLKNVLDLYINFCYDDYNKVESITIENYRRLCFDDGKIEDFLQTFKFVVWDNNVFHEAMSFFFGMDAVYFKINPAC